MLQPGIKGHHEQTVTPAMSAARVGSGLVDVFATPMLVALVARHRLIKERQLDPEAVRQFITANGTRFSDRDRQQNQPPAIIIQR